MEVIKEFWPILFAGGVSLLVLIIQLIVLRLTRSVWKDYVIFKYFGKGRDE